MPLISHKNKWEVLAIFCWAVVNVAYSMPVYVDHFGWHVFSLLLLTCIHVGLMAIGVLVSFKKISFVGACVLVAATMVLWHICGSVNMSLNPLLSNHSRWDVFSKMLVSKEQLFSVGFSGVIGIVEVVVAWFATVYVVRLIRIVRK